MACLLCENVFWFIIMSYKGEPSLKKEVKMPIYKVNGKKDGLQRYRVRINYLSDSGEPKQLTRIVYGDTNAKNLEMRLNNDIRNKIEQPIKKMTVQELFNEFIAIKKMEVKELTIVKITENFKFYILPTFKNCRIDKISIKMLQDWKIFMEEKKLALNTKTSAFIDFRAMLKYAIRMEYINKNPFDKTINFKDKSTVKKNMDFYTVEEFKKFINKVREIAEKKEKNEKNLSEWNFYIFFNIAFFTGLRKGEIHALKWSDIEGKYLSVKRSISQRIGDLETSPKNPSSIRILQMPTPLIKVLEEHKERYQQLHNFTDDFRICNNIRNGTIQIKNKLYSTSAGVKTIRIHDFRHSHVSALANANINIQEVARRLGHAKIEMTWNTYCHLYPKEEEKAVKVFNSFI